MNGCFPAVAASLFEAQPGVLAPALVQEVEVSVGARAPNQARDGIDGEPQLVANGGSAFQLGVPQRLRDVAVNPEVTAPDGVDRDRYVVALEHASVAHHDPVSGDGRAPGEHLLDARDESVDVVEQRPEIARRRLAVGADQLFRADRQREERAERAIHERNSATLVLDHHAEAEVCHQGAEPLRFDTGVGRVTRGLGSRHALGHRW